MGWDSGATPPHPSSIHAMLGTRVVCSDDVAAAGFIRSSLRVSAPGLSITNSQLIILPQPGPEAVQVYYLGASWEEHLEIRSQAEGWSALERRRATR